MADDVKRSRLFFLCIPRSGSTSILKCLSSGVEGIEAWFEPYIIAKIAIQEYKAHMGKVLPNDWSEDVKSEFDEAARLIHNMNKLPLVDGKKFSFSDVKYSIENSECPQVVVKDMAGSFSDGRVRYLPSPDSGFKYVFIIRDPQLAISSYRRASIGAAHKIPGFKLHENPQEDFDLHTDDPYYYSEGGKYFNLHVAWRYVRQNLDPDPLIIDCEDLMANPKPFLQKICEVGGLQFHDGMLEWDASRDIVQTWKNPGGVPKMLANSLGSFHQTAINSTCFKSGKKEKPPLASESKDVQKAVTDGTEYYNEMYEHRFKP